MAIQHKLIAPISGNLNSGNHVAHHWQFSDVASMNSGNDLFYGSVAFSASDVGRIAKVGSGATGSFYILMDHTVPTFKSISDGSTFSSSFAPDYFSNNGFDDFTEIFTTNWDVTEDIAGTGTVVLYSNLNAYNRPGPGWAVLGVESATADASIVQRSALALNETNPIVYQWRQTVTDLFFNNNNLSCSWYAGAFTPSLASFNGLYSENGAAKLIVGASSASVSLPSLPSNKEWTFKLTLSSSVATLEAAVATGSFSTIGQVTASITRDPLSFGLYIQGAGYNVGRVLLSDYVSWKAGRYVELSGTASAPAFYDQYNLDTLAGDVAEAILDSDFPYTSNSERMYVIGPNGQYGTKLDKFDATFAPTANDDAIDGYSVGSFWYDATANIGYTCVHPNVGSAIWQRIGENTSFTASVNAFTASITASVNSLLNFSQSINLSNSIPTKLEYDIYLGSAVSGAVLFREEFATDFDLWTVSAAGAGATAGLLALNRRPTGHCRLLPGTTNTGSVRISPALNFWYSSYGGRLVWNTIAMLPSAAPIPTDDYEVIINLVGDTTNGFGFIAKSGSAPNYWKAIRYNAGVSSSIDCVGFTASYNYSSQGADKRFTLDYDVDRATASFYIDNQFQARFTGSQIPSINAAFMYPGWTNKVTGTTSINTVFLDYTEAVYYATSSWYRG